MPASRPDRKIPDPDICPVCKCDTTMWVRSYHARFARLRQHLLDLLSMADGSEQRTLVFARYDRAVYELIGRWTALKLTHRCDSDAAELENFKLLLEEIGERAAIMEYDGGLPRKEAERRAKLLVLAQVT